MNTPAITRSSGARLLSLGFAVGISLGFGVNKGWAGTGAMPGLDTPPVDFWSRSHLTGNWGGTRDELDRDGVDFSVVYINEVLGNPSGGNFGRGVIDAGLLNVGLDLDLEKLGGWKGASFHANGLWIHGDSLTRQDVGDYSVLSSIDAYNTARLDELWLQQTFLDGKISLRAGQLAVDTEFFSTTYGALFINATFGAFPLVANDFQKFSSPTYPLASPAMRLKLRPVDCFYAQTAVFDGDAGTQPGNNRGVRIDFHGATGVLIFSEIGYLLNQGRDDHGLPGTYKMGSWVHTADFPTWISQADLANGTGPLRGSGVNYGIYGGIDQVAWQSGDEQLAFFLRAGTSPAEASQVDFYLDGGINLTGFIPGRKNDVFGLALARSAFSHEFSDASVAQGGPAFRDEVIVEGTYDIALAPWWNLQPDLQYVFSAGGTTSSPDALVIGLRSTVSF